jgi:hypothetical protein
MLAIDASMKSRSVFERMTRFQPSSRTARNEERHFGKDRPRRKRLRERVPVGEAETCATPPAGPRDT